MIICLDIGGTYIKGARIGLDFKLPHSPHLLIKTDKMNGAEGIIQQVIASVEELGKGSGEKIDAISIGSPGLIDSVNGVIKTALNLPGWSNISLHNILGDLFSVPVFIENDGNLSVLGEWHYIYEQKPNNMIFIVVSTGIGGGIIQSGKLFQGTTGSAGEFGHMSVDYMGELCSECQKGHGCLTSIASGTAIENYVKSTINHDSVIWMLCGGDISKINGTLIKRAAELGDVLALNAFSRAAEALGQGIVNVIHMFDPELVVLGGGVANSYEFIYPVIGKVLDKRLLDNSRKDILQPSKLGILHGIAGASVNAKEKLLG